MCAQAGHTVKRYHADNGRYADQGFLASINSNDQTITFCGVGAHHQNGIAERRIEDLTELARSMLMHAAHRNKAVTSNLWPYALAHASYTRRMIPREGHSKSPEEFFSRFL